MRMHMYRWLLASTLISGTALAQPRPPTVTIEVGPREAPPTPREERHEFRKGSVWVAGHWEWRHGKWDWEAGRFERERGGKRWREPKWEQHEGKWVKVEGDWIAAEAFPSAEPPPMREEKMEPRHGHIYVRGRWEWQAGNWEWLPGHYEREQPNKRWREARWEKKEGHFVLVEGGWDEAPRHPMAAPPALRDEKFETRNGFVYVRGRWDWKNGNWEWLPGHHEKVREKMVWSEGKWELRGDHWEWVEGSWAAAPVSRYPNAAPPSLRDERAEAKAGHVWVRGRWDWKNGNWEWVPGHHEKLREKMVWSEGKWELRGDHWEWVEGSWSAEVRVHVPTVTVTPR